MRTWMAIGCLLATSFGWGERANERSSAPHTLLVVAQADEPIEADARLRDHLRTALGHRVTLVAGPDEPDLDGVDLVVVSESVSSQDVGATYREATVPVLVMENAIFADMGFGAGDGTLEGRRDVVVEAQDADISGELVRGVHTVVAERADMKFVQDLAPGGTVIAGASRPHERPIAFRFDAGADLTEGTAPARRVGLGFKAESYPAFTEVGWDLFDASVGWLLEDLPPPRGRLAMLLIGGEEANASELSIRSRLRTSGFDVNTVRATDSMDAEPDAFDLVVMSKTVESEQVGTQLTDAPVPVLFWEDNQQMIGMLATIEDDGSDSTAWHAPGTAVRIAPGAPAELTAGLEGVVDFYRETKEITYAPAGSLPEGAIAVASFGDEEDGRREAIYAYEAGAPLADGEPAAGPRGYFGLYDDSYTSLTLAGVDLFDAMIAWLTSAGAAAAEAG